MAGPVSTSAICGRTGALTRFDSPASSCTETVHVAANSFIAAGGDGFTVFKEGTNPETLGGDLDALETHIQSLPRPFSVPDPATEQRITRQG